MSDEPKQEQQDKCQYKKNKMGVGTKAILTTGIMGGAVYLTSKKIWNYFYPPSFKRYFAVLALGTTFYGVSHCDKTAKFVGDAFSGVKQEYTEFKTGRTAVNEKNYELSQKEQELNELKNLIKEQTGKQVEFRISNKDVPIAYNPPQEGGLYEPDKPIGSRPGSYENYENKTPVVFVQKKGITLAEIASQVTGNASNWKELAEYNRKEIFSNSNVTIYMGEKLNIPVKYVQGFSELKWLGKNEMPRKYFQRQKGESLEDAMIKNLGSLSREREILDYNRKLMPAINFDQQEIFWVPEKK